ncbi:unnamed protein product [Phytophthora fragariaefolia]|uniref:Unnamed protein product n=1 Tax=Phytophthora fragariaefolia TaxID=1490495 RepID=A0A9W6Y4L9_9STRA|nr:unnamed protein product [Phytophthora fragariaefolia]
MGHSRSTTVVSVDTTAGSPARRLKQEVKLQKGKEELTAAQEQDKDGRDGGAENEEDAAAAERVPALAKVEFLFRETLTMKTSRTKRVLDSAAVDTALTSSKTLFDLFLAKWQEQKECEEQKREEEEEMFKYSAGLGNGGIAA